MKTKSILALIAVLGFGALLGFSGCRAHRRASSQSEKQAAEAAKTGEGNAEAAEAANVELSIKAPDDNGMDFAEKEELRRKFPAKEIRGVSLRGINGPVTIETADTDDAEVLIVRSAKSRDDLTQYRKVKIEVHDQTLVINIENDRKSLFSAMAKIPEGRQRVVMKLPRKMDFEANGISGDVTLGELRGRIELRGVNGLIKAVRVAGKTQIDGVNGGIEITFAPLTGNGIEINGVNGNIDLRFDGEVNADLNTWGINGQITPDLPGMENKTEETGRGRLKARIGGGGAQIRIGGINGNVKLAKAEKSSATAKTASK